MSTDTKIYREKLDFQMGEQSENVSQCFARASSLDKNYTDKINHHREQKPPLE